MILTVSLNKGEMAVAKLQAEMRTKANRSEGVEDQRRDDKLSGVELDFLGTRSELAWYKLTGAYPDLSIHPRKGTPDAIYKGRTIDIKATTNINGKLLATTDKEKRSGAEFYVLAIVRDDTVDFVGYANAKALLDKQTITNLGHGPTHALRQHQLRKFTRRFLEDTRSPRPGRAAA